jgi:uncharacterized protein YpuA (DUF1002 family)
LAKKLKGADVIVRERQKRVAERGNDESSYPKKAAPTNRAVADLINVVKKNVTQTKPDIPKKTEQPNMKNKDQQKKTKSGDGAPNAKRRKME